MIVVLPIVFAFGALLLWALYAEEVEAGPDVRPAPEWPSLPTAADVARARFPLAPFGYDRARVNDHLQHAAALVADLQARLVAADAPDDFLVAPSSAPDLPPVPPADPEPDDSSV